MSVINLFIIRLVQICFAFADFYCFNFVETLTTHWFVHLNNKEALKEVEGNDNCCPAVHIYVIIKLYC